MDVYIEKYNLLVLNDKNEFLKCLLSGNLKQKLIYLQKEKLFIHKENWLQVLRSGRN